MTVMGILADNPATENQTAHSAAIVHSAPVFA
jgi:hypothetical protein